MPRICSDITETVGHTPLVRLNRTSARHQARADILLKLEFFNPLSSVKDRIGVALIEGALRSGLINRNTVLIEPTSGCAGLSLAFAAAARGLRLILVMPENAPFEQRKLLKILGAKTVLTRASRGMSSAMDKADELHRRIPDSLILDQFNHPDNPGIHRRTTAAEIWDDTDGAVDILVAGVGTGGTLTGVGEALKVRKPGVRVVAVEPATSPVLSGGRPGAHRLQGLGPGFIPGVFNPKICDEIILVRDTDAARVAQQVARLDGIPVGISSGAAIQAALQVARRPENAGRQIVVIVPSAAERYLFTWLFDGIDAGSDSIADLLDSIARPPAISTPALESVTLTTGSPAPPEDFRFSPPRMSPESVVNSSSRSSSEA
ncbi:cysteine synthase A [Opitutaceae bacterium TAV1]|nr:cysteine synthase A [Opitutaceae bacterium TAV1]